MRTKSTYMKNVFMILILLLATLNFACKKESSEDIIQNTTIVQESAVSKKSGNSVILSNGKDQRKELQDLINTWAGKNETLVLPSGKFIISDELILPSNASVEGSGNSTEIKLTSGSRQGRNVFKILTRTSNIRLKNIKINANQAENTGADLVALYVTDNVSNLHFENVNFAGGRDRGSVQIKGLNDYQVKNVTFLNCNFSEAGRTSLELRGTRDVSITNCVFANWGSQNSNSPAVQLQSQHNYNTRITKNTFNNTLGTQFAIECAAAYVIDAEITDNRLNDPNNLGGNGISGYYKNTLISKNIFSGGNGNHRSGLEIFGQKNTLSFNTIPAGSIAIAPGLKEDGFAIMINDNNIKTKGDNVGGIQMGNGGNNLNDITVKNNIVDTRLSKGNSSGIVVGTYGIPRVVSNITVEGNTIYTNAHCIRMQALPGSKDIYLLRNICQEGYSWLGVITNTFTNVKAVGNVKNLSNKAISYSVNMSPIIEQ